MIISFLKTYDLRNSKAIKLKNFPYFRYHVLKEILKKRKNKISQIPPFGPKSRCSKFRSNFAAGVTNRGKFSFILVYEIQTVCTRSKIQRRFDFARANSQSLYARIIHRPRTLSVANQAAADRCVSRC